MPNIEAATAAVDVEVFEMPEEVNVEAAERLAEQFAEETLAFMGLTGTLSAFREACPVKEGDPRRNPEADAKWIINILASSGKITRSTYDEAVRATTAEQAQPVDPKPDAKSKKK